MSINTQVTFDLPIASSTQLGGVAVQSSSGLLVDSSGDLSVDNTQFLSVSQAASIYATQASTSNFVTASQVESDISAAQNGVQFNNSISVVTVSTSSGTTVTVPQNVYLILVNGPASNNNTNPTYGSFILQMPTPIADGHTFEVAAGDVSNVTYTVPSGSTAIVQTFGGPTYYGTYSFDSVSTYMVGYGYSKKFTYIESTNMWYGR
jgi:hypothetical protein